MNIKIHRGTDQIGGCVTEYEYGGWHLFVDYGEQLPGVEPSEPVEVEGLTKGDLSKSALLITHYHGDHTGYIHLIPEAVPVYMGEVALKIQKEYSKHLSGVLAKQKKNFERLQKAKTFTPGKVFKFGDFSIIPVTVDHSAFDAYAFKIVAGEMSVFHTGDFRTHGFRGGKLPKVVDRYIGKVDYVVCEGTNVLHQDTSIMTESELQQKFIKQFKQHKGNVVYVSSTNIDRLFSLYQAALRAKRPFYVDGYQKRIMDIATKDPIWGKSELYQYGKYEPVELIGKSGKFEVSKKFRDFVSSQGYVLITRANEKYNKFIEQIPGDKMRYLSMWEGYVDSDNPAYNERLVNALGEDYITLHTSGHCNMESLRFLFCQLSPRGIIPIHTNDPEKFEQTFRDEWNVIRLHDGQSVNLVTES